jgi:hypothetical protein
VLGAALVSGGDDVVAADVSTASDVAVAVLTSTGSSSSSVSAATAVTTTNTPMMVQAQTGSFANRRLKIDRWGSLTIGDGSICAGGPVGGGN